MLSVDGSVPSVSPTTTGGVTGTPRNALFIKPDMDIEKLSESELVYVHTMIHKLYGSKAKGITKEQLIELHNKVKQKINHIDFDGLDKK